MKNTGTEYMSTERTPTVRPDFAELLPPLSNEQLFLLEADILKNGCYAPVIVNEELVIVDGHNRASICDKHGVPYRMAVFSFEDDLEAKQWALDTQKSRRNLEKWELGKIALKLKPEIEARAKANMGQRTDLSVNSPKGSDTVDTRKELAKAVGIGEQHVRSEGQIVKKAVYIAIGVNLDGRKDVLGMWVGENESAKFWATVLNGLKNRGVEDIFIACTDNLTGFDAAIHATFPQTEIQNCIIHQLRNSSKYVSYKDLKALMADLKAVYAAVDEQAALDALDAFGERWDKKYPKISQSWRSNWANLSTYFKYPQEVRRLIYTTNAIEGFNRQLRKVTKAKSVFPTDDSLLKMLYLAMIDITKKWTGRRQDWSIIHAQMALYFAERMPE